MKGKFNIEANASNQFLKLTITGRIWYGEMANALRTVIDEALAKGVTSSELLLTTPGGNVYEAIDVIAELKRLPNLKIVTGSIVASAGTRILCEFDNVDANKATQFMIHKPMVSLDGNEDEIQAELINLKNITDDYRKAYAKKFNLKESEIESKWKQNYWMNSDQALKLGLITSVIEEEIPYNASVVEMMVACGCPNIPKPTAQTPPENSNENNTMDINQLRAAFGMSADATEEQVLAKAKELKSTADSAAANMAITAEQKRKAAETVIDKAILVDKKITAEQRESFIALHINDAANTEALLATMKGVTPASAGIKETPEGGGNSESARSNWTLEDYLEKDPNALDALIQTNPEKVRQLNAAYAAKK